MRVFRRFVLPLLLMKLGIGGVVILLWRQQIVALLEEALRWLK